MEVRVPFVCHNALSGFDDHLVVKVMWYSGNVGRCACSCRRFMDVKSKAWRLIAEARYPSETLLEKSYDFDWMCLVRDDNRRNGIRVRYCDVRCNWLLNSSASCYQARIAAAALKDDVLILLVDARGENDLRSATSSRVRIAVQQPTNAMNVEEILNTRGFDPSSFAQSQGCLSYSTPGRNVCSLRFKCKSYHTYSTPTMYYFNYGGASDYADVPLFQLPPHTSLRDFFAKKSTFVKDPQWTHTENLTPHLLIQAVGPDDLPWFRLGPLRNVHLRHRFNTGGWGGGPVDQTNPELQQPLDISYPERG